MLNFVFTIYNSQLPQIQHVQNEVYLLSALQFISLLNSSSQLVYQHHLVSQILEFVHTLPFLYL